MRSTNPKVATTELKIDPVADKIGYTSRAHFPKAYPKWVGMWPPEYREGKSGVEL
ncbi:MAG: hypothetical protein P8M04_06305 [Akkermansiaceae bacterium]|nr:hypothetical protein [Akkermansiaceae bacterium]